MVGFVVTGGRWAPWGAAVVLALAYGPGLLGSTLLAGDLPGHLEAIRWSAERLWPLPWGWDPRFLCGAPLGILYPPLLAWIGGALGQVMSAEAALRVLLLGSIVALPPALARAGRGLGLRRHEAGWAALAGVAVLWLPARGLGGSLRQTLVAGNAANALALPLLCLFTGSLRFALARPRRWAASAACLGLLLLAHVLMAIAAGGLLLGAVLAALRARRARASLRRGAAIAVAGAAAGAPFLLPLAWHLGEGSPDAIAYSPPPGIAEWLSLLALGALLVLLPRRARRPLLGAAAAVGTLYALRILILPLAGAPPVRMEYHRFRLLLYLLLVPAAFLGLRRTLARPRAGAVTCAGLAAAVLGLATLARHPAAGPAPLPLPQAGAVPAGQRVLVLADPASQGGAWHGAQTRVPPSLGAAGLKGVFVESSPLARQIFRAEQATSGPDRLPRWWAIRVGEPLPRFEVAPALRSLGVDAIVAREPVGSIVATLRRGPPIALGNRWTLHPLEPAPLARTASGWGRPLPARAGRWGDTVRVQLGAQPLDATLAVSWFSDWRIVRGRAALLRHEPGFLGLRGEGEVHLAVRPRTEEWAGLVIGLAAWLLLGALAWSWRP